MGNRNYLTGLGDGAVRTPSFTGLEGFAAPKPTSKPQSSGGFLDTVGDIGESLFRGAEEAVHDLYGLVDWALPEVMQWDDARFFRDVVGFGEAETTGGEIAQGISQFLTGFLLTGAALKGATALKGANVLSKTAKGAAQFATKGGRIRKDIVKGAITDFSFFDEHEERLSNLLADNQIGGPIAQFLAADDDDSIVAGRLKNAIEGAGLGLLFDGIFVGLKKMRAGKAAKDAGADPAGVKAAMDAVDGEEGVENAVKTSATNDPAMTPVPDDTLKRVVTDMGLDDVTDEQVKANAIGSVDKFTDPDLPMLKGNPRDMDPLERQLLGLHKNDINLTPYENADGNVAVLRAAESLLHKAGKASRSRNHAEGALAARNQVKGAMGLTGVRADSWDRRLALSMGEDVENLEALHARVLAYRWYTEASANKYWETLRGVVGDQDPIDAINSMTRDQLLDLKRAHLAYEPAFREMRLLKSEMGRGLNELKIDVSKTGPSNPRSGAPKKTLVDGVEDEAEVLLANAGGEKELRRELKKLYASMKDPTTRVSGFAGATGVARKGEGMRMITEYWINSILSGPMTHVVNITSNMVASYHRPLENLLGSGFGLLNKNEARRALAEIRYLTEGFTDMFRMGRGKDVKDIIKDVWNNPESVLVRESKIAAQGKLAEAGLGGPAITGDRLAQTWVGRMAPWLFGSDAGQAAVDRAGALIRTPTRALQASDEAFKQVNYRAAMRSDAYIHALSQDMTVAQANQYAIDVLQNTIMDGQAYSRRQVWMEGYADSAKHPVIKDHEDLRFSHATQFMEGRYNKFGGKDVPLQKWSDRALARAQEVTFQTAPDGKSIIDKFSKQTHSLVRAVPVMRMFIPFIQTPVNILKYATDRVGADPVIGTVKWGLHKVKLLNMSKAAEGGNKLVRELLSQDETVVSAARGRMATAVGFWTVGTGLAMAAVDPNSSFAITGRGPTDPKARAAWKDAGHQEYSVKIGDSYFSYQRFDPFATMLGLVADIAQYGHFDDDIETGNTEAVMNGAIFAIANNLTNKTYLQGLDNFMTLMKGDPDEAQRVMRQYGGSFIPNILGQANRAIDDDVKEVRSMTDALMAKIPWWSGEVEARRNVLGEVVKRTPAAGSDYLGQWTNAIVPVTVTEMSKDPLMEELAKTQHGWSPIGKTMSYRRISADLTEFRNEEGQTALDRVRELSSTVTVGGRTMRQVLTDIVKSPEYQALPESSGDVDIDNPRYIKIARVISRFRSVARTQLLREYPELREHFKSKLQRRKLL